MSDEKQLAKALGPHWWVHFGKALCKVIMPSDFYKIGPTHNRYFDDVGLRALQKDWQHGLGSRRTTLSSVRASIFFTISGFIYLAAAQGRRWIMPCISWSGVSGSRRYLEHRTHRDIWSFRFASDRGAELSPRRTFWLRLFGQSKIGAGVRAISTEPKPRGVCSKSQPAMEWCWYFTRVRRRLCNARSSLAGRSRTIRCCKFGWEPRAD